MARLGDVCEILNGFAFRSERYVGEGFRIIRISNVQKGYIEDSTPVFYSLDSVEAKKYALKENDLLISLTGNVGRVGILPRELLPATLNQRVACIRIKNESQLTKPYLFNSLNSDYFEARCIDSSKGVAQKNISTEWLKEYEIPLPSLEEQRRIAATLDKVSDLIAKRQAQLNKLDLLVKARFVEMFGDPSRNTRWPTMKLFQLGELNRGVSKHRPRNDPRLLGGAYPLIQTGDVSNSGLYILNYSSTYSELGLEQSRLWKSGTLCITIAANIAQTAILSFDACFPDSIVGFVPNYKTDSVFIHYWFSFFQKIIEDQAPQVAQKNINLKILRDLDVIVPPHTLQEVFSDFVRHVENSKLTIQQSLDTLETLKKALMQLYFG